MVRGFHNFFFENLSCVGDFHANLSPIILYTILNLGIINTKNYDRCSVQTYQNITEQRSEFL